MAAMLTPTGLRPLHTYSTRECLHQPKAVAVVDGAQTFVRYCVLSASSIKVFNDFSCLARPYCYFSDLYEKPQSK